jgi:hypothetical protein
MNRKLLAITLMALLVLLLSVGRATSQGPEPEGDVQSEGDVSAAATVNSQISFQGRLTESGTPVTDVRDMTFRLYSDETCFTQVGSDIVRNDVPVEDGLFSVKLDVDQSHFSGQGLWLKVLVDSTTVMNCEEILPVPYALGVRPGANIVGAVQGLSIIYAENESDTLLSKGVHGNATAGSGVTIGVLGESFSTSGRGVAGWAGAGSGTTSGVWGQSLSSSGRGVYGTCDSGRGVYGTSNSGTGVYAESDSGYGVYASSGGSYGILGTSSSASGTGVRGLASGQGVYGESSSLSGIGVRGKNSSTDSDSDGIGVQGSSYYGIGVLGLGGNGVGVRGEGLDVGVYADSTSGTGVYAESDSGVGVHAISNSDTALWAQTSGGIAGVDARNTGGGHGVYAESAGPGGGGAAVYAQANGADGIALWGNSDSTDATLVVVNDGTGDLIRGFGSGWNFGFRVENDGRTTVPVLAITGGSDLSEQFDVTAAKGEVAPGLVVCIDAKHPGKLLVCNGAYDRAVAGVVSGAGGIEPGMVMGQQGSPADGAYPVALTGRVYVWADASAGPIQPGDLLTTSDTPGHVMRVSDYGQAQGAIIGKAMSSLDQGQGLILVLVSLQ